MRISFRHCSRGRTHELRVDLSGRPWQRTEPVSRRRSAHRSRGRLDQSFSGSVLRPRSGWHTLRGYAFDLTHFIRWWADRHSTDEVTEQALTTSSLLDYMRYQAEQQPRPAATTINTRVWVAERALRCQFPDVVPPAAPGFHQFYWRQSALGYGRSRPALTRLRVKVPK